MQNRYARNRYLKKTRPSLVRELSSSTLSEVSVSKEEEKSSDKVQSSLTRGQTKAKKLKRVSISLNGTLVVSKPPQKEETNNYNSKTKPCNILTPSFAFLYLKSRFPIFDGKECCKEKPSFEADDSPNNLNASTAPRKSQRGIVRSIRLVLIAVSFDF